MPDAAQAARLDAARRAGARRLPDRRRRARPPPEPPHRAAAGTRPPRIGLALGGGAARGFAHIGVIQVLEEAGIKPDLVVGTSAGSLVAALYASGKTAAAAGRAGRAWTRAAITDWAFPGRGLIRGEALARYVREQTGGRPIEQMKLPLGIVATDLDSGAPVLFQRGDTGAGGARVQRGAGGVPAGAHRQPRIRGRRPGLAGAGALCARRWAPSS